MLMSALQAATQMRNSAAQVEHGRTKLRQLALENSHEEDVLRTKLAHKQTMFGLKADLMRDLVNALIEQRVDAVRQSFVEVLTIYANQCNHYMAQQERYADAEIKAVEPLERANLRARLTEVDLHLTSIREDAGALYREMTKVILLIGGAMPAMPHQDHHALALTNNG